MVQKWKLWNIGLHLFFFHLDRDIQCDFDNPFWEVNDCNWVQDEVQIENFGLGTNFDKKLSRILATNEDKAGNYWKRSTSLTGEQCHIFLFIIFKSASAKCSLLAIGFVVLLCCLPFPQKVNDNWLRSYHNPSKTKKALCKSLQVSCKSEQVWAYPRKSTQVIILYI